MTCEELAHGGSFLHRLDPRIKVIVLTLASFVIATLETKAYAAMALGAGFILMASARLPHKAVLWRVVGFNTFCLLMWLTVPFTTPGEPVMHLFGPIHVSSAGIETVMTVTLKSNAILLLTLALMATSEITQITHALSHLRCPARAVQLFYFTWRYIHVISEEAGRLKDAMKLRGFHPSQGLKNYRYLGYLISAIFIKSYDTGIQVQRAMELRGFDGTFWLIHHFTMEKKDMAFLVSGIAFLAWIFIGDHGVRPF